MGYNPDKHHRKSIRLKKYDYTNEGKYFITICTLNRECLLGHISKGIVTLSESGKIIEKCWQNLSKHFHTIEIDLFIIMPNHIHGIISIFRDRDNKFYSAEIKSGTNSGSIGAIIQNFKSVSTRKINKIMRRDSVKLWQRNYYERIIRDEKELNHVREYIKNNPVEWDFDRETPNNPDVGAKHLITIKSKRDLNL